MKVRIYLALFLGLSVAIGVTQALEVPKIGQLATNISSTRYWSDFFYTLSKLIKSALPQLKEVKTQLNDVYVQLDDAKKQIAPVRDQIIALKQGLQITDAGGEVSLDAIIPADYRALLPKDLKKPLSKALNTLGKLLPKIENKVAKALEKAIDDTLAQKNRTLELVDQKVDAIITNVEHKDPILQKTLVQRINTLGDIAKGLNLRVPEGIAKALGGFWNV